MDIYTISQNLRTTIAGKEQALAEYQEIRKLATMAEDSALFAIVSFLKLNIFELKRLLEDVEQCVAKDVEK